MAVPGQPPHQIRFGEFALDLHTAELRDKSRKLTLQDQPFQVLVFLLERAGQLVSRDELRKRLWPADTFGDFDHGLNKAVNRLREVLRDSAENPRFIETLPRKGYRFIAPLQEVRPDGASSQAAAARLSNLSGKKVSHYRVLDLLGGGGMGVVYKAEDTKLGRRVALKFLPQELGSNLVALERFEREARAASALNHPNICTIYAFEEHEGQSFLAMELLEGETLRELISGARIGAESLSSWKGPVPLDKLLNTAIQVTNGLAAAHQKGIIHRDIKPANVFLTRQGQVKILDFGLAKLQGSQVPERSASADKQKQEWSPNLTVTRTGETIGTTGYMSPEQVRGEELDFRTDLFSLGMVLYEMVTGQRAFPGDTAVIVRHAILNDAPTPIREVHSQVPTRLESIINRALEKDRDARYQSAGDMCADLEKLTHEILPRRRYALRMTTLAAAFVAAIGVAAVALWDRSPVPSPRIVGSKQLTNDGLPKVGALVTDGARIYFGESSSSRNTLNEVSTAGGETVPIEAPVTDPLIMDISPDQSKLLVQSAVPGPKGSDFWLLTLPKGSPRRLEGVVGSAGGWARTPNGEFAFAEGKDLYVASHNGANPRKIATAPQPVADLQFSPDGSRLRFSIAELGKSAIWEVRTDGSAMHRLLPESNSPSYDCCGNWTPDGRYYFFQRLREGLSTIWIMRDHPGLLSNGSPEPVQLTVGPLSLTTPVSSTDGKHLFVVGEHRRAELVRYDRNSGELAPFLGGISAGHLEFCHDGKWISYVTFPDGLLWRSRPDGSERLQLTSPPMRAAFVRWSPDGQQIAFSASTAPGRPHKIFLISREGGAPQQLTSDEFVEADPTWSPDGQRLAYGIYLPGRPYENWVQLIDLRTRKSSKLPGSSGFCFPSWSPDGRSIAAIPFDARKLMLFDFTSQKWRQLISNVDTIGYFSWSPDSSYLYFNNLFSKNPAYFRLRIRDSRLERIASLKDMRLFIWDFGVPWTGLTPDETPLFVRDISTQEIYALDWQLP